jgi:hypothetical protein
MYTFNAKRLKWWSTVRLLVWGPSAKLLSVDQELQDSIKKMKEMGVELYACKGCADSYGVTEKLEELGITVMYTGEALTNMLKSEEWKVITI